MLTYVTGAVSEAQQTEEIQKVTRVDTGIAQTVSESSREITINGALNASASPAPTHDQIPVGAPTPEKQPSDGPPAEVPTNGVEETIHDTSLVREDVENENIKTKPAKALQRKRKKRKSVVLGPKRKSIARAAQPSQAASGPAQEDTTAQNEVTEVAAEKSPTPEQPLKRQGRRQKATPPNVEREPEGLREPQREEQSGTPVIDQSSGETAHGVEDTVGDNQALETAAEAVENNVEDEADRHDNEEPSIKRPKAKQKKTTTNQRTRPNRRRPNPEEVPEEVAQETPEVEDQPGQPETSTGRQQIRQRRERKPRGETVPVVVHRLANLDALEVDLDEESPDETAPSASANRIPSRGGVNAADVLSQICRETLEKTMSTLENSISQESNPARRAEWTRKRKAVEAFSTELGHRLFDMSEIIESNSVLAAQVKRERKEMAALRNRLMEVRKERRDIALKIDDVRRKYTEEEQVNRVCHPSTIVSHSLLTFPRNKISSTTLCTTLNWLSSAVTEAGKTTQSQIPLLASSSSSAQSLRMSAPSPLIPKVVS